MAFESLKKMLNPDDEENLEYDDVVETSKSSSKETYKNKTILVEPRAFSEAQQIADY